VYDVVDPLNCFVIGTWRCKIFSDHEAEIGVRAEILDGSALRLLSFSFLIARPLYCKAVFESEDECSETD
jgi:hypothetical protein